MRIVKEPEASLRIIVLCPPPGVLFALQRDRSELVSPIRSTGARISFDFSARLIFNPDGEGVDFRGRFVQGPRGGRFVYVNSGTFAGDQASCWSRRAKIPLTGITPSLGRELSAAPEARLEAFIQGTGKDGGPVCATVPLLEPGWAMVE